MPFEVRSGTRPLPICDRPGPGPPRVQAHREALGYREHSLTALTHLPETRETVEQAIDVRFDLRNVLQPPAEFGRIEGYLREAEALARRLDDQRRLGWVWAFMTDQLLATGGHATDMRMFSQRVEAIGEAFGDVPLQVVAQYYLALGCYTAGDYGEAEKRLPEIDAVAPGRADP